MAHPVNHLHLMTVFFRTGFSEMMLTQEIRQASKFTDSDLQPPTELPGRKDFI